MQRFYKTVAILVLGIIGPALATDHVTTPRTEFNIEKAGQAGLTFLNIHMTARGAAVGNAQSLVVTGAQAIFTNPASVPIFVGQAAVFTGQVSWFADISANAVAFIVKLPDYPLVLGASLVTMDYGTIHGTFLGQAPIDAEGYTPFGYTAAGNVDVSQFVAGLTAATRVTDRFSMGVNVRYANEELWSNREATKSIHISATDSLVLKDTTGVTSVSPIAFDFGTRYATGFHSLMISMTIRNFARTVFHEDQTGDYTLPVEFRIGLAANVLDFVGMEGDVTHKLTVAVDGIHPRDHSEKLALGAEYSLMDILFLRSGYTLNEDAVGLSAGLGIHYKVSGVQTEFDYSFSDVGTALGSIHRWGISVGF